MRSDDQHLTIKANGFPLCSLVPGVEVGTISANELRNIVDHLGSLGSEELVYICIGLNIYRVSDDVTHSHPTEVVARLVLYPVSAQVFDNVGEGCLRLRVQSIDELDNLYLLWDGAIHTGLDSVHNDVLKLISIRHSAAHVEPLSAARAICVDDTLLDGLAFKLGENHDYHQHSLSDGG